MILFQFCLLQFLLRVQIVGRTLLHVVIYSPQSLFILLHAQVKAVLELLLLREDGAVVDLLDCFPFTAERLLDVDNHVVSVPLAAVLHILDECVPNLADFDPGEDLGDHVLLDTISPSLEVIECLLQRVYL